jgi:hypothetical protein
LLAIWAEIRSAASCTVLIFSAPAYNISAHTAGKRAHSELRHVWKQKKTVLT